MFCLRKYLFIISITITFTTTTTSQTAINSPTASITTSTSSNNFSKSAPTLKSKTKMQFSTSFITLLLASSALAGILRRVPDDETTSVDYDTGANSTEIDDGVEPEFDPLELADAPFIDERDLAAFYDSAEEGEPEEESAIEARATVGDKIVTCAKGFKGTPYKYGGCKTTKPFGPGSAGMDCSCLSMTCVYRATKTVIPRKSIAQYSTKAGKCHQIARSSAKPGDLLFWGCTSSSSSGIHHVGIYSRSGHIWHAPRTGYTVTEAKIWTAGICSKAVRCW